MATSTSHAALAQHFPNAKYLSTLNANQLSAVTDITSTALVVLAGPGSGKTKTLSCRVAYLLESVPPERVMVVTFTNKAAKEMEERVHGVVAVEKAKKINMGTFHSICANYLRRYGSRVSLKQNFSIADAGDSRGMLKSIVKEYGLDEVNDSYYANEISKAKAQNMSAERYEQVYFSDYMKRSVASVYAEYVKKLSANNLLDFDDLLMYGHRLFSTFPDVVSNIDWLIVDEFQDTNTVQYEIIRTIMKSGATKLTVVGDPDQCIYGWRSADITNVNKVQKDFANTAVVRLEENYRSSPAILKCSYHVISQDADRIEKRLWTRNPSILPITIKECADSVKEAKFIGKQIQRLLERSKGLLTPGDFAVLIRTGALSQPLEEAFQSLRLPYKLIGAHRFFDRIEIKDVLAYLRLIDNWHDTVAFQRIINTPRRELGPKTLGIILNASASLKMSPMAVVEAVVEGKDKQVTALWHGGGGGATKGTRKNDSGKKSLTKFLNLMRELKVFAMKGVSIVDIIEQLVKDIGYEDYLKKAFPKDFEGKWGNVNALMVYAERFEKDEAAKGSKTDTGNNNDKATTNCLTKFLEVTSLATDVKDNEEEGQRIVISTLHAAKGLEWPCVFVVGVETGILPHARSTTPVEEAEERRLLYVGMTRAKVFLYLTHCQKRQMFGNTSYPSLSWFLKDLPDDDTNTRTLTRLTIQHWMSVAKMLNRKGSFAWEDEGEIVEDDDEDENEGEIGTEENEDEMMYPSTTVTQSIARSQKLMGTQSHGFASATTLYQKQQFSQALKSSQPDPNAAKSSTMATGFVSASASFTAASSQMAASTTMAKFQSSSSTSGTSSFAFKPPSFVTKSVQQPIPASSSITATTTTTTSASSVSFYKQKPSATNRVVVENKTAKAQFLSAFANAKPAPSTNNSTTKQEQDEQVEFIAPTLPPPRFARPTAAVIDLTQEDDDDFDMVSTNRIAASASAARHRISGTQQSQEMLLSIPETQGLKSWLNVENSAPPSQTVKKIKIETTPSTKTSTSKPKKKRSSADTKKSTTTKSTTKKKSSKSSSSSSSSASTSSKSISSSAAAQPVLTNFFNKHSSS